MPLDVGGLALLVILPGFVAYAISYYLVDVKIRKSAFEITLWSLFLSLLIYAPMSTSISSKNFNILDAGNEPITIILLIVGMILSLFLKKQ